MKLLVVTSLKEYLPEISSLLKEAGVGVYSMSRTTGIKTSDGADLTAEWFGADTGAFDSVFLFSFTDEDIADRALSLVESYNELHPSGWPVRAFVLPVEKMSQSSKNYKL